MDDEAAVHRGRLEGLRSHALRQVMWAECGERAARARLADADGYNARHYEEEIERNSNRAAMFRDEAESLTYAIELIDKWEDAAADARFEDRG